jgi:hypothetical protein
MALAKPFPKSLRANNGTFRSGHNPFFFYNDKLATKFVNEGNKLP